MEDHMWLVNASMALPQTVQTYTLHEEEAEKVCRKEVHVMKCSRLHCHGQHGLEGGIQATMEGSQDNEWEG